MHGCPDRIYLLLTGYNVTPGGRIADIVINYADETSQVEPLIGGANLPEWTIRPVRAVAGAKLAYAQDPKGIWITWIDNPDNRPIKSLALRAAGGVGLLMLYAITAAYDWRPARPLAAELEKMRGHLRKLLEESAVLTDALREIYGAMRLPAADIEASLKKNVVRWYCAAAEYYLENGAGA